MQAKVDKAMADERKKNARLSKELEKMKRDKMTADELKNTMTKIEKRTRRT